ncbi:hypothetical protein CROQUDRAFT_661124 [Cronartium quercuum f. sp. fusiforme G11]|uniref:Domain of unknown function at the cortex 1 domain-containing protein n=1 Tax=Cronartium quercuum f. sp. fusiforme G11 TaxID=708437 RepID=A0A9P6NBE2_9BASI|nr:hypothetical protein CROQUDRAFT_661124 [Cronartium quercuum f. sp. fusiforme G11]
MKRRGPRIEILAGPTLDNLSKVNVNADYTAPLPIKTDSFEGLLTVRIKNFAGVDGEIYRDAESRYFLYNHDITWSIQVRGRFLKPTKADECVFGNTFDKPIRDRLPYGTALAVKAISYIDPGFSSDLYADKPWAWSPLLATMNLINTQKLPADDSPLPEWDGHRPREDCSTLMPKAMSPPKAHVRRKHFSVQANREEITLGPRGFLNAEFCNGFLDFSTLALKVPVVNVSFSLDKLWDGQPVRYQCLNRKTDECYWVVVFQIAALEAENQLEEDDEDSNEEQTSEENFVVSRRATRGNSAAMRPPDDLPPFINSDVD